MCWYEYSKWPSRNIGTNIDSSEMSRYEYVALAKVLEPPS